MRKWSQQDYKTMPWKNGGGSTTELAVFPEGASLEHFVWRVSTALVSSDGAFSHFAQIDRSLAILSGAGMSLHADSDGIHTPSSVTLTRDSMPYYFAGETPIRAELLDDPVRDLNLMTRRDVCTHFMQRLEAGEHYVTAQDAQQILLYCAQGQAILNREIDLREADLVLLDEDHERAGVRMVVQANEDSVLYLMRISFLNLAGA
ncbi:HutD family protein [Undibacterium sp. Jales W-56]|uniref:HutD/Ves family protein n=1 Tax=Undibacterium sp. Jales W-56 TaxID=2897325 RepID=UPI0021CFCA1A|nr:HutD family protein [Undibacterium sp. Jales W-56]MCU6432942.1 HutD family protein [Undibacterium sp. Jales W-56]